MARRFFVLPVLLATLCFADQTPPQIANARNSAIGLINTDGVYVRSGAGDNYYPTTKLNKTTKVTIVGEKFDWLKIVPPQGSFCYVAKAFIDRKTGSSGVANREDVNVRAGSELNTVKTTVQSKLSSGQAVEIIGEVDEYYKITPPMDAYVYVKKDYVDLEKVIPQVAATPTAPQTPEGGNEANSTTLQTPPLLTGNNGSSATTNPAIAEPVVAASTQPAVAAAAQTSFEKTEAEFETASKLPIEKQPVDELTKTYTKLQADATLPESLRRIVDFRLQTLKVRADTRDQFLASQKALAETKQKQIAMKAEQEEIAQRIKQQDVKVYTAVGTLRTSSIQQGGQIMYRLTDPTTGRTVCYLRSDDPKYGQLLGQFIGVRGQLAAEPGLNLKVVTGSDFAKVDPNELYRGVAAQIVPPSLLPNAAQVANTTTNNE